VSVGIFEKEYTNQFKNIYYCLFNAMKPLIVSTNSAWCVLAAFKKGCFKSIWAVGRSAGDLVKHFYTKSRKSSDQRAFIGGGDFLTMLKITFC
jgi:hypothetical protein